MSRLFVAVWPPSRVLDQVEELPRDESGWRWTTRAAWHVTLRFLGEASEEAAVEALAGVRHPPVDVTIGPTVARLGSGVLMVPVAGLDDLAAEVVRATSAVGRPPEDRPFRGHLTLARWRGRGRGRSALIRTAVAGSFRAEEIHLVRSETRSEGPRYTTVAVRALGA